ETGRRGEGERGRRGDGERGTRNGEGEKGRRGEGEKGGFFVSPFLPFSASPCLFVPLFVPLPLFP
ncbi:MAG TPA: hypothetical protein VFH31_09990, partial [Pyrinomonadaceae bacterium]|nr:hypothetical protein [Pyrinomonadaceae bacterium]